MKSPLLPLALLTFLAGVQLARGQVTVGLELSQEQFLPGESIPVSVRITNFSGQTLKLGQDDFWLQFSLEAQSGRPIASLDNVPVEGEFELPNATIATKRLDLAPHYPPLDRGQYILSTSVIIPNWNRRVNAAQKEFTITPGTILWEQTFGLPQPAGSTAPPEVRRYALQQAVHVKEMKLYAQVSRGSDNHPLAVFPIGPMLTFSNPEKQIDAKSRFHVLYQYGARSFYYCIIEPSGELLLKHTYDYAGPSRPTLRMEDTGAVFVLGGIRRPAPDDVPAEAQPAPNPPPPPPPPAP